MRHLLTALLGLAVLDLGLGCGAPLAGAAEHRLQLRITGGEQGRTNIPIAVPVTLPPAAAKLPVVEITVGGQKLVGQWTKPGLLAAESSTSSADAGARELHFILPKLEAKQVLEAEVVSSDKPTAGEQFVWKEEGKEHIDLQYGSTLVARYMCEPYNEAKEHRERTYKVYHHVFDPSGKTRLTKGPGSQYTHHRGIYYGFNKCSYGAGKNADVWHCSAKAHQSHAGVVSAEAGPVLGRHVLAIDWYGADGALFAKELRELSFYRTAAGMVVGFASRLTSLDGKLKLDGDPQHAGFQFRASEEVGEKTAKQTRYIRPDGVAELGATRQGKEQPWNAMSFVVGGERYTCAYLDHPRNPKPCFYSERDYGRFGSYFVAQIEGPKTLDIRYRLWIQPGEMTPEGVASQAANFSDPPVVTIP